MKYNGITYFKIKIQPHELPKVSVSMRFFYFLRTIILMQFGNIQLDMAPFLSTDANHTSSLNLSKAFSFCVSVSMKLCIFSHVVIQLLFSASIA
jgi:hypothetical protein